MRPPRLTALLLGIVVAACDPAASNGSKTAAQPPPPAPPMLVEVLPTRGGTLQDEWVFLGDVRSERRASLAASASGTVEWVAVRIGDRVDRGQQLIEIDPSLARARMEAARASERETVQELELAQRERARAERLGADVLAEAEIERDVTRDQTLRARAQRLGAAQREAAVQLERHRLTAPFDGIISARYVDPGDWVDPGHPAFELVSEREVDVLVSVPPELLERVTVGERVELRSERGEVEAEVAGVVRALDPTTRTGRLRVVPKEVPSWLLPGIPVNVAFSVLRTDEGVIVPRDALVYGAIEPRVMKVEGDVAAAIAVRVLASAGDEALVSADGLAVGDQVVVRGNERLRPGQPVRATPHQPQTKTARSEHAGPTEG